MPLTEETAARSPVMTLVLFVLVVAVVGVGVWVFIDRLPSGDVAPVAVDAGGEAALQVPSVTPAPAAGATPGPATPPVAPALAPGTKSQAPGGAVPSGGQPRAQRARPVSSEPTAPVTSTASPAPAASPTPPVLPRPAPEPPTPSSRPPVPAADPSIYDAGTAGVAPPILLTPMASVTVRTDGRYVPGGPAIEIIVNDDGLVTSVKAVTRPASLAEALEMYNGLSTTKSWRFTPAARNGQSVKYRFFIPLSALQILRVPQ